MIKKLLSIAAVAVTFAGTASAQTNLDFEQWNGNTPTGWSAPLATFATGSVAKETVDPAEGTASVKLTTTPCAFCGFAGLPDTIGGFIQQKVAFGDVITSVDVMLKANIPAGDTAAFIIQATSGFDPNGGNAVGIAGTRIPGGLGNLPWNGYNLPFNVINGNLNTDTITIFAASGDGLLFGSRQGVAGGELYVDGIVINFTVGSKELAPITRTIASPNPATNSISIFTSSQNNGASLSIIDALGRVVFTKEIDSVKEIIDLANYNAGVYFFEIAKKDGTKDAGKFIVTK